MSLLIQLRLIFQYSTILGTHSSQILFIELESKAKQNPTDKKEIIKTRERILLSILF